MKDLGRSPPDKVMQLNNNNNENENECGPIGRKLLLFAASSVTGRFFLFSLSPNLCVCEIHFSMSATKAAKSLLLTLHTLHICDLQEGFVGHRLNS